MIHQRSVTSVAFSPDGKTIATGSLDMSARLWHAATGLPIGPPLEREGAVKSPTGTFVSFSPDGKTVAISSIQENTVRLGNPATGLPVGKPLEHQGAVLSLAFSPDGKTIVTGSSRTARLWDAATGLPVGQPMAHQAMVLAVAFSPDGTAILTGSTDNTARLWNAAAGLPTGRPFEFQDGVRSAVFSPDRSKFLTIGVDAGKTTRLWDTSTGSPIGPPMSDPDGVFSAAFSPDGKTIVTGSHRNLVRRLDAATRLPVGPPMNVGNTAATQPVDLRIMLPVFGPSVAYSPNGKTFLVLNEGGSARLWNAATGQPIMHQANANSTAFSPDGKILVIGSSDKMARSWDASTGRSIGTPLEHKGAVSSVAFSPDGKIIVTGSQDGTARLWAAATGQPIGLPLVHQGTVYSVAFSPDGKSVLTRTTVNAIMTLWDVTTSQPISRSIMHEDGFKGAIAFSPDSKTILAGSISNGAQLWDAATGQPIGPPLEHGRWVNSEVFSPDGKSIVTESYDAFPKGLSNMQSTAQLRHLPALVDDDLPRIKTWVETITGEAVDDEGSIHAVETAAWQERRVRLRQLGGPPKTDSRWLFDPILYGPDPTARARAWSERKCWAEAEAAFTEVIRARPFRAMAWVERGRFYAVRSEPEKAAADFAQALELGDRDPKLLSDIVASSTVFDRTLALLPRDATLLSIELQFHRAIHLAKEGRLDQARSVLCQAGALPWEEARGWALYPEPGEMLALLGCWDKVATLFSKYKQTTDPSRANELAWCCVLAPGAPIDPNALVRLAELAVKGFPAEQKHAALNTLGAALYRAGRFEDAIRRLGEGIQLRSGKSLPQDWVFLAMAHHRLGHRDEARRWLDRLRNRQPSMNPKQFWDELEIRILRSEAEAAVLYDPVFPPDPFAD